MTALEIIQVVREMHPFGGAGGVAFALDGEFRAAGVRTSAITLDRPGTRARRASAPLRAGTVRRSAEVVRFTLQASVAIRRRQAPERVFLVHGDALGGDIYIDHGLHKAMVEAQPGLLLRNPLHAFIAVREALRHGGDGHVVDVCSSEPAAEALRRAYPRRTAALEVIPNGVDLARFHPAACVLARPVLDCARLVFVGDDFERKGLTIVLGALARLPAEVTLTVIGGSESDIARHRRLAATRGVAERTRFLGHRTDVADRLGACDLLVLPSRAEAWPLATLEAMACAVPVLIAPMPAARDIIGAPPAGLMVERTPEAVAAAVQRLRADPAGFAGLRRAAVAQAARFGWPKIARAYVDLAERVAAARVRG